MQLRPRAMPLVAALAGILALVPRADAQHVVPQPVRPETPRPLEWRVSMPAVRPAGVITDGETVHAFPGNRPPTALFPTGRADPRGAEDALVLPGDRIRQSTLPRPIPRGSTPPAPFTPRETDRFLQHVVVGMFVGMVVGTAVGTVLGARCDTCIAGPVGGAMGGFIGGLGAGAAAGAVAYVIALPFRD